MNRPDIEEHIKANQEILPHYLLDETSNIDKNMSKLIKLWITDNQYTLLLEKALDILSIKTDNCIPNNKCLSTNCNKCIKEYCLKLAEQQLKEEEVLKK